MLQFLNPNNLNLVTYHTGNGPLDQAHLLALILMSDLVISKLVI